MSTINGNIVDPKDEKEQEEHEPFNDDGNGGYDNDINGGFI